MSRHGIKVEKEEVLKEMFHGLAGGDTEEDCIDIVEMVAMLLIPYLVKTVVDEHTNIYVKEYSGQRIPSRMNKK